MNKLILGLASLLFLQNGLASESETILLISKTMNEKNILHYKVDFEPSKCEFTEEGIKAVWKMNEEDGRWKPLTDSMKMIRKPLMPKIISKSSDEIVFETPSMEELKELNILDEGRVSIRISPGVNQVCEIQTLALIDSEVIDVDRLHSKVSMFGSVKWVQVLGRDLDGKKYTKKFKNK